MHGYRRSVVAQVTLRNDMVRGEHVFRHEPAVSRAWADTSRDFAEFRRWVSDAAALARAAALCFSS